MAVLLRILAISGSLRAVSSNTSALQAAALIARPGVEVWLYPDLARLPPFNPDLDTDEPPETVQALRREIGLCDGLLISSPEYAHGMPGVLKNVLDWLVGSVEFAGTPTALINNSPRSVHAVAQRRETLTMMAAELVESASVTLDLAGRSLDAAGIAADPTLGGQLRDALAHFVEAIEATKATRE